MTMQAAITIVILVATLAILASQRLRADLVAICSLLALVLTGVLKPEEAFSAFGQPLIIIIPCIYVLGAALYETGVATLIADRLVRISGQGPRLLLLVLMLAAGLLSAILSSMLVIAVFMPAALRMARRARLAPAQLLLPLAAAATMGNLLTLIGTVSNLVVSDLLAVAGYGPLGFFSLTPYGLASLALAIAWYLLLGRRLLRRELPPEPQRPSLEDVEQDYALARQLYRLRVRTASDLIGRRLDEADLGIRFRVNVLAVQPRARAESGQSRPRPRPARPDWVLAQDDLLIVDGERGDILQAAGRHCLEPKGALPLEEFNRFEQETLRLAELMVPFRSRWVGRSLADIRFRERYGLNILAAHRQGEAIRSRLPELTLAAGDTLLVHGPQSALQRIGQDLDLVLVTHLGPEPGELVTPKARWTLAILVVMVAAVASGLLSLAVASLAATVALILSGCIRLDRAYRSIDGSVIVLICGMLPLALALDKTGAARLIAGQLAGLSMAVGPLGTLLLLYLLAVLITQVVSNSATAALMVPIAISLARTQGLPPQPFAIAMAVAVTTSYLTPITNSDNLLVREAGRYQMRDYLVNHLPLLLLQMAALLAIVWATGLR